MRNKIVLRLFGIALLLSMTMFLSSCGQTGPLYLPPPPAAHAIHAPGFLHH